MPKKTQKRSQKQLDVTEVPQMQAVLVLLVHVVRMRFVIKDLVCCEEFHQTFFMLCCEGAVGLLEATRSTFFFSISVQLYITLPPLFLCGLHRPYLWHLYVLSACSCVLENRTEHVRSTYLPRTYPEISPAFLHVDRT